MQKPSTLTKPSSTIKTTTTTSTVNKPLNTKPMSMPKPGIKIVHK